MNIPVNYLGVLLAAVASMVVGFIYYSPFVVGKQWMKLSGMTEMGGKGAAMAKLYGISFVLALVTAYVLSHVMTFSMSYLHETAVVTALMTGLFMWLGFIVPVQATDYLFGKKPIQLVAINMGYQLLSVLAMGLVLAYV